MEDDFYMIIWRALVLIFLALIFAVLVDIEKAVSAEPQSAVVEFTSAEDLIARKDSVMAVCDTVYAQVWKQTNHIGSLAPGETVEIGINLSELTGERIPVAIRHRRLVGVTVTEPLGLEWFRDYEAEKRDSTLMAIYRKVTDPGTAVVFFDWIKE